MAKLNIARISLLAIFVLFFSISQAYAQGNDFIPGAPPWGQVPWIPPGAPGPVIPPPGNSNWSSGGTAHQTLWGVRRGETIVFDAVLDGWGLGALYLGPMCSNCTNMRYMPPIDGSASQQEQWWHGVFGYWCHRCEWRAEAGDDNPTIWIDYTSQRNSWFAAHLEWKYTIPAPPRQLYSAEEKENARWWRDTIGFAANGIGGFTAGYCVVRQDRFCAAGGLAYFIATMFQNHFANIVQDPWDDWYQYPAEPDHRGFDPAAWGWGWMGDPDTDALMVATMAVVPYAWAADTTINRTSSCILANDPCQWWQQQRLQDMHYIAGPWLQNATAHLANIRDQAWWEGIYDAYDPFNQAVYWLWGAGEYLIYLANQGL